MVDCRLLLTSTLTCGKTTAGGEGINIPVENITSANGGSRYSPLVVAVGHLWLLDHPGVFGPSNVCPRKLGWALVGLAFSARPL
jgi:hypothetical protein